MSDVEPDDSPATGTTDVTESRPSDDPEPVSAEGPEPSDAFQALGNEVRMQVLATLLDASRDGSGVRSFSDLFEASDAENTAGFAYHLRQLTPHYLREVEDGYAFTSAGLSVARAIAAGTFTDSVDRDPVSLDDPCPLCHGELTARTADNVLAVGCEDCERTLLSLSFPPAGYRAHAEDLPAAFDRHHRHRLTLMADGVCPECGGVVESEAEHVPAFEAATDASGGGENADADVPPSVQFHLTCDTCGYELATPATLAVLDHPAVVSFYHDHGEHIRDRPIWNVGAEWRETLVSEDPWCLRVTTRLDDELLSLFVDRSLDVLETRRGSAEPAAS